MNDESDEQDDKALFQQAMQVFNPFAFPGEAPDTKRQPGEETPEAEAGNASQDNGDVIDTLREQMSAMQKQLDSLVRKKD